MTSYCALKEPKSFTLGLVVGDRRGRRGLVDFATIGPNTIYNKKLNYFFWSKNRPSVLNGLSYLRYFEENLLGSIIKRLNKTNIFGKYV